MKTSATASMTSERRQSGAALVELAFVLPLLLMMSFITTEFGRALYQYNTITKSVRDAVRYLTFQTPGQGDVAAPDAVRNLVVYGSTANTGVPLALGLDQANVRVIWGNQGTAPIINVVTVRVQNYCFIPMWPSVFGRAFTTGACANGAQGIPYGVISASMRAQL